MRLLVSRWLGYLKPNVRVLKQSFAMFSHRNFFVQIINANELIIVIAIVFRLHCSPTYFIAIASVAQRKDEEKNIEMNVSEMKISIKFIYLGSTKTVLLLNGRVGKQWIFEANAAKSVHPIDRKKMHVFVCVCIRSGYVFPFQRKYARCINLV